MKPMKRVVLGRSRVARPRAAPGKAKSVPEKVETYSKFFLKMVVIVSCVEFIFLCWELLRLLHPSIDTPSILVGAVILSAICIVWAPKLQILRLRFRTNIERFNAENEARKTIATVIGGLAIFASFYISQRQLGVQQQVQFTDRYSKAIEEIAASDSSGSPTLAVRVGGLYVLEQIMDTSEAQHASIVDVLCAYIRDNSTQKALQPDNGTRGDVRVALTILGRRNREMEFSADRKRSLGILKTLIFERQITDSFSSRFVPPKLDLSDSNLPYVELNQMVLGGANLSGAHLPYCTAILSDLTAVDFSNADLSACTLASALDGADFANANLQFAAVSGKISHVNLQGAQLAFSTWIGADFEFPRDVQAAKDWSLAFYKPSDLVTLGLPADHNERLFKLVQSRTPSANIEERVRLSLALQNVQKAFQALQEAKDKISNLTSPDPQSK
jgi:uncharacterized protein YjbI with pentapeptide repeats